jgi:Spy/CpxP family protein refolding chaperone
MMKSKLLLVLLVGALSVPGAALAQGQHEHGDDEKESRGMMGQGMMKQGMMGQGMMSGRGPSMILKQKEALELTEAQVQRLEALQKELSETREAHMKEMSPVKKQVGEALEGDKPDLSSYESALKKLADGHVRMQVDMARFSEQALEVLTAEQRSNVRYGMRLKQGMMCGEMMQGGGMMGGGSQQHETK